MEIKNSRKWHLGEKKKKKKFHTSNYKVTEQLSFLGHNIS